MKWVIKTAIAVALFFCCSFLTAEESGPWGFQNIAIINVPFRNLKVIRSLDRRAVELHFTEWDETIEASIKQALSKSPLHYRLHPLRQTRMAVEIYSVTSEVDFAAKPTSRETQFIIGEVRGEKLISDLLKQDVRAVPIPQVADMVRMGKFTAARNELYRIRDQHKQGTQYLFRTRVALIDFLKRGRSAVRCPHISFVQLGDRESYEALLLNAWCKRTRNESDEALNYLKMLEQAKPEAELSARANQLEQMIISGRILTMDRLNRPADTAALALKHIDVIGTSLTEISFIENIAENLIAMNLASPLASLIQEMIARDKRQRVRELEPILVESYLAASKYVLASDAANYFLFKTQSSWNRGRLLRGYGLSLLQTGDWKKAATSLTESKALGVAWGIIEDLAVLEAHIRAGAPNEKLNEILMYIDTHYHKLPRRYWDWYLRLASEIDFRQGKEIKKDTLAKLPGFVLFNEAMKAQTEGNITRGRHVSGVLEKKKTGWQKLFQTISEIEEMQKEITDIEKTLEKIR